LGQPQREVTESEDALIRMAIEIASMGTDLADFKDGWNTVIGERGLYAFGGTETEDRHSPGYDSASGNPGVGRLAFRGGCGNRKENSFGID